MSDRAPEKLTLAVIVPSRDRSDLLEACILSLLNQVTGADYEVIVVDDGSTDDTQERMNDLVKNHSERLSYLKQPPRGLNASRNTGYGATDADVLAFVDDDTIVPESYVDAIVEGVSRHPDIDCFGGRIRLRLEGKKPRWCGNEPIGETELEEGLTDRSIPHAWGANLIVTRRGLEKVGPFKEDLALYGDEVEWQHRIKQAGGSVMYLADAWVWHRRLEPDIRLSRRVRRGYRIGTSYPRVAMIMEQHVSPWGGLWKVVTGLFHSGRRGCSVGIVGAAQGLGHMSAALRLLIAGTKSPYLHWTPARRAR